MAVAFDANSTAQSNVTATTTITHNNLTVGSGSNRALVVFLAFGGASAIPASLTVTWDSGGTNQACTAIAGTTNTTAGLSAGTILYGLVAPTSGNKTLAVSWSGAQEAHCAALSVTGADQTGGATTFPNGTTSGATATSSTITVTSASGNLPCALAIQNIGNWSTNNQTLILNDNTGPNVGQQTQRAAGASTVTFTGGIGGGSFQYQTSGVDIAAAAAAGGSPPPSSAVLIPWYNDWT